MVCTLKRQAQHVLCDYCAFKGHNYTFSPVLQLNVFLLSICSSCLDPCQSQLKLCTNATNVKKIEHSVTGVTGVHLRDITYF